ncbi:MarR family transcriptional regulator [Oceanobacillus oncorhynchi]|uniref:MarR family transcriptional regulator n=1 Tax=Oceanobacillus oncorhynchi TaxID=545501 RepID=UPI0018683C37|nr:MarR family transcriptional regulator [Oceanobacillus oncorhynchi]UUI39375.1 MarR family transcriptional regulator [Oceanobacillus oncorhynchi]
MVHKFIIAYGKILDSDISGSQVYMLEILTAEGAKKSSELSERIGISLPAITNLTNKLVQKGYIERKTSENDRRITLMQITPLGSEVLDQINEKYSTLTDSLWKNFSDEELHELHGYYKKMVDNLKEYRIDKEK